jgi:pantoate--beta-alanine ligase
MMTTVITKASEMTAWSAQQKNQGLTIGFVPTMGALHDGHISLVNKAKKVNDKVVVSIFVNPTQFNDKKDLEKYPRTLDKDIELLTPQEVDVVFAPDTNEIYPKGDTESANIDLGGLDAYMEGAFRPGHFKGVAQVVKRLLDIVMPNHLYMGQKDFQQFSIIQYMLLSLKINTQLVVCPILREPNGLAMSSRNERLSPATRDAASIIYKVLKSAKRLMLSKSPDQIIEVAMKKLKMPPIEPEYFSIVDGNLLTPVSDFNSSDYVVACVAVWADGVRLIDNLILKKS